MTLSYACNGTGHLLKRGYGGLSHTAAAHTENLENGGTGASLTRLPHAQKTWKTGVPGPLSHGCRTHRKPGKRGYRELSHTAGTHRKPGKRGYRGLSYTAAACTRNIWVKSWRAKLLRAHALKPHSLGPSPHSALCQLCDLRHRS